MTTIVLTTATFGEMANLLGSIDEHGLAAAGELVVRAVRAGQRVPKPVQFTLESRSQELVAACVRTYHTLNRMWSAEHDLDDLVLCAPDEAAWWNILPAIEGLFRSGLHTALMRGGRPLYAPQIVSRHLLALARSPDADDIRSQIYSTLAVVEKARAVVVPVDRSAWVQGTLAR